MRVKVFWKESNYTPHSYTDWNRDLKETIHNFEGNVAGAVSIAYDDLGYQIHLVVFNKETNQFLTVPLDSCTEIESNP